MNCSIKHILRSIGVISLCAVASSCSQDPLDMEKNGDFISGESPLKLTADVAEMITRAGEKDSWIDEDSIRVRIGTYPWIGKYKLNPNGSVKEAIEALAWPHPNDSVRAWFPCLEEKTVVSIADQSEGYHAFDFMSASTNGVVSYKDIVHLNFKHKMSKVSCELLAGDGVTDEDLKTAKISYFGYNSVTFNEKELSVSDEDWIIPFSNSEALLYPQNMSGKNFIKVELTVNVYGVDIPKTLIYIPEDGKGTLEAGKHYTYTIKVQKDRLVVQTITGEWNDDNGSENAGEVLHRVNFPQNHNQTLSFSSNVTPVYGDTRAGEDILYILVKGKDFTISYDVTDANYMKGFVPIVEETGNLSMNCSQSGDGFTFRYTLKSQTVNLKYDDYAQVGDIYYSDGTWSRAKIEGKTPIGIVFRTDTLGTGDKPGNYDWADNRSIRGYVVALEDASESKGPWQAKKKEHGHVL